MAFDLVKGRAEGRNWARGDGGEVGGWFWEKVEDEGWKQVAKRIPWKPMLITAAVAIGAFLVIPRVVRKLRLREDARRTRGAFLDDWVDEPTTLLVRKERTADLLRKLKRAA